MSWKDSLTVSLAKFGLIPKSLLIRAFGRLREKYFKAEEKIKMLEEEIKKLKHKGGNLDPNEPPPSTPSSQIPPYKKGGGSKKGGGKKNGQKKGHEGHARGSADEITNEEDALPKQTCDCGSKCGDPFLISERTVEDIEIVKKKTTKVYIYGCTCKICGATHKAVVNDVLKGNQIGNMVLVWSIYLHFFVGISVRNVADVCQMLLGFNISGGGLIQNWHRIADILEPAYEKLVLQLNKEGHVHADETGWRISGSSWWAWVFTNTQVCVYIIANSRGSQIAREFLGEFFEGVLISDFFSAYGLVEAIAKQKCYAHIFTELKKCLQQDKSGSLKAFSKKLKRLLRDAIKLNIEYREKKVTWEQFQKRVSYLEKRLDELIKKPVGIQNQNVKRLRKRLRKHRDEIFTFLYFDGIDPTNNIAERRIRLIALMRKVSFGSYSEKGVKTRYILMSLLQTCKILKVDFISYCRYALNEHLHDREVPGIHEYIEVLKENMSVAV